MAHPTSSPKRSDPQLYMDEKIEAGQKLVVQNDIEKRTMNLQAGLAIVNEA